MVMIMVMIKLELVVYTNGNLCSPPKSRDVLVHFVDILPPFNQKKIVRRACFEYYSRSTGTAVKDYNVLLS